jgi:hypothetical protein
MKINLLKYAVLGASLIASPAYAAKPIKPTPAPAPALPGCSNTDITPTALACAGYFDKNVLSGNAADMATQTSALANLGLTWNGVTIEKLNGPLNPVGFSTVLNGLTFIGIHFGRGNGPVDTPGGVTAFYRFDAGVNARNFQINHGSVSGVSLYSTGLPPVGVVPEPATWAMMILGFGLIGGTLRRRQSIRVAYA